MTSEPKLLVSDLSLQTQDVRVHKYEFVRSKERATMLQAVRFKDVGSAWSSQPAQLGGE